MNLEKIENSKFKALSSDEANKIEGGRWKVYSSSIVAGPNDECGTRVMMVNTHWFRPDEYKVNQDQAGA